MKPEIENHKAPTVHPWPHASRTEMDPNPREVAAERARRHRILPQTALVISTDPRHWISVISQLPIEGCVQNPKQ